MIRCGGEWSPRRNNVAEGGITYYKIIARTIRRFLVFVVRPNDRLSLSSPRVHVFLWCCCCSFFFFYYLLHPVSQHAHRMCLLLLPMYAMLCSTCTSVWLPVWLAGWLALAGMGNAPHMHTEANESSLPPNVRWCLYGITTPPSTRYEYSRYVDLPSQ